MAKGKLNFLVDALLFLNLMALAGLGFLMKYILPPGRELWVRYGANVDLTWLGWDRHDWGQIHLYLAFLLLGLLTLHIILHWQTILALFAKYVPSERLRRRLSLAFLLLALLLIYFPFLITPEVSDRGRGGRHRSHLPGGDLPAVLAVAQTLPAGRTCPASCGAKVSRFLLVYP